MRRAVFALGYAGAALALLGLLGAALPFLLGGAAIAAGFGWTAGRHRVEGEVGVFGGAGADGGSDGGGDGGGGGK